MKQRSVQSERPNYYFLMNTAFKVASALLGAYSVYQYFNDNTNDPRKKLIEQLEKKRMDIMNMKSRERDLCQSRIHEIKQIIHSMKKEKAKFMEELHEAKSNNTYHISLFHNYEGFINIDILRKEDNKTLISNIILPTPDYCDSSRRIVGLKSYSMDYQNNEFEVQVENDCSCIMVYFVIEKVMKYLGIISESTMVTLQHGSYTTPRTKEKMDPYIRTYTINTHPGYQTKTKTIAMKIKEIDHTNYNELLQSKTISCDELIMKLGSLIYCV